MADLPETQKLIDVIKQEITLYETDTKKWYERARKISRRYKDERGTETESKTRFNILYSNIQTLLPAAYGSNPNPDIERRFRDDDVLGRVTSDILERCTAYFVKTEKFGSTVKKSLLDRLLGGRGIAWARYIPHMRDMELQQFPEEIQEEGQEITNDAEMGDEVKEPAPLAEPLQEVYYEEAYPDYVHMEDFGHNIARVWHEVWIVWRRVFLDKDEIKERFPDITEDQLAEIAFDQGMMDEKSGNENKSEQVRNKAEIFECWNIKTKKAYWLHKQSKEFLDEVDDPLGLPDFFPCPKPLYAVLDNNSLVPTPDYVEYQDQARELDEITARISSITKSLKIVGVYDASVEGLSRLLEEGYENYMIPISQWTTFAAKNGLEGTTSFLPIEQNAKVLLALYDARDRVKADLYEITGIADIIRGDTKASETATAQRIKGQFATLRLSDLQGKTSEFAKDLVVKIANIIAKHFSIDTIKQISGVRLMTAQEKQTFQMQQQQIQGQYAQAQKMQQAAQAQGQNLPAPPPPPPIDNKMQEMLDNPTWEEVEQLLRDQPHLCFKIDIETDSTIISDRQEEQQARVEFLKAAGEFMVQMKDMPPETMPLLAEMLMFGVRGFKVGKAIEGQFRVMMNKIEQMAKNPPPPKPDPAMAKVQADIQAQQARAVADKADAENDAKMKIAEMQQDHNFKMQEQANNFNLKIREMELEAEMDMKQHAMTIASNEKIASQQQKDL